MKRAAPELGPKSALGELGRAARFDAGEGRELWRLSTSDRALAERLLSLGARGIGRFVDGGEDDDGVWLVAAPRTPTLAEWMKQGPRARPWREAVALAIALAQALAACEAESLFPGPLSPRGVLVRGPERVVLAADGLVRTLVGVADAGGASADSASPRWIAPEQASGAPWDNAANRYVLGLFFYRWLAGEHAFVGRGLRLGLDEAARRAPAPLAEFIAAELPPGLMSLTLGLLDPDPRARPKSAREIAEKLARFLEAASEPVLPRLVRAPAPLELPPVASVAPRRRVRVTLRARARVLAPLAAGLGLGAAALAALGPGPSRAGEPLVRSPLTRDQTLASDCASCHPRQTGEWHRSVMAHSVKSPMFQALEMLVEEQVGRDVDCPNGAGILRAADGRSACRDPSSGIEVTGSGGELWCVNCHAPAENLAPSLPAWAGRDGATRSRDPLRDLLPEAALEGVSCGFCHQVHGPVGPGASARGGYEGNPFWLSTRSGERFATRPEDRRGLPGISNSGYSLDPNELLADAVEAADRVAGGSHAGPSDAARGYLESSEFCGACHDVRLFGSDVLGARKGEHFKRLRNAYSEWAAWATSVRQAGRVPASCQDCHMSSYPGVCERGAESGPSRGCPPGSHFSARAPGSFPAARVATSSARETPVFSHYFTGVDIPLTPEFPRELIDEQSVDALGVPLGASYRRELLLASSVELALEPGRVRAGRVELPLRVENVGAGHRVPAGFSQERELWVELTLRDARGDLVYRVGHVERDDEDLGDKVFLRINTDDRRTDGRGRPLGLFGADVTDGPDVPRWSPNSARGGTLFRGRGLVNFQNGFLRCVTCRGSIDALGHCQAAPGQEQTRAERYADGDYDIDTGECRSNLSGDDALFETYFPVGALDSTRGVVKAPDAIIDTRSLPPGVVERYVYELDTGAHPAPFRAEARLLFRAFPPYLIRAFAEYEERQARAGRRPSGPLIDAGAARRNRIVELARASAVLE